MIQTKFNLPAARAARGAGIALVSDHNREWLDVVREVAIGIARRKGWACADDVREWCEANDFRPHHHNAYGAIFRSREFVPGEYIVSAQVQGHGNRVRVHRLKEAA